ncbi:MAG: tetratricopeptide repeat protein [Candidatus Cloacimonas sp.]|jgi:tetratricopeptide (TPR) repeat protein/DNA-binding beta-propeller fold protein YncE|nr:tetratricopeptide repeat protein [Candidatus Cloacimonas sp.]
MRRSGLGLVMLVLMWTTLFAIPQPLHVVPVSKSKEAPFGSDTFHIQANIIYTVDNTLGIIKAWDTSTKAFLKPVFAKLPLGTQANDITGDDKSLYVLDSKNSCVYVYDLEGTIKRTISSKGSPEIQFKQAIRILVNYQSYIYVLDAVRNELLAFTNEGMFLGRTTTFAPISMTLGQDQLIRVLLDKKMYQEVVIFDSDLNQAKGFEVLTPNNKRDMVGDLAINQYNELYVIYTGSTRIGKVDSNGRVLPKPWGSKDKSDSQLSFMQPAIIKVFPQLNNAILAIQDNYSRQIKVYVDSEFSSLVKLEVPQYTMRPFLEEIPEPICVDNIIPDSLSYYLYDTSISGGGTKKIMTRAVVCKSAGKTLFSVFCANLANKGVKSFDGLAFYKHKLFVLDSKACKIVVLNRYTGEYLDSFASKGSKDGRLNSPSSIVAAPDGMIYVADSGNSRIAVFNENSAFIENIDLKDQKLKPQLLRLGTGYLYFMANGNSIHEVSLADSRKISVIASIKSIPTFDVLYENRIGFIDGETQQLVILFNNKREKTFFAKNTKSVFPCFGEIQHIRYNPDEKTLLLSDKLASSARQLRFYYSPKKPQTIRLQLNALLQAELSWDIAEGIGKWIVNEHTETESDAFNVSEPRYTIKLPQPGIYKYSVRSLTEDGKSGPATEEIEDAYSYALYLRDNNNFTQAIIAFKRAASTISDPRLDEEMIKTYMSEAQFFIKLQEFEKALSSLESAVNIKGAQMDQIQAIVDVYKQMKNYKQGIDYLEKFKADDNQSMQRQLIALYYLNKNYAKVQSLATTYIAKFGRDTDVTRYYALANENLGDYQSALTSMRELLVLEDNFDNNLKVGSLLIRTKNYDDALTHLQRMLTRFPTESHHAIYKLLGDVSFAVGYYGNAQDFYLSALRTNDLNAEYHYSLALAYYESRQANEAQYHFAQAYDLDKTNVSYGFAYAKSLEKVNRFPEALAVLDTINKFATADSTSTEFLSFYADLLTREHRYDDAYRELSIAVKFSPQDTMLKAKLQAAVEARDFYNQNKPAINITNIVFEKLYPSLQEYYATHPIGSLTMINNRIVPIQDVQLSISFPQISDRPFQITIPSLLPSEAYLVDIIAPINNNIFSICKNGPASIPTKLRLEYSFNNQNYESTYEEATIPAQNISAMNWDNRKQFASFVNPKDEHLRTFVSTQIVQLYANAPAHQLNKNIQRAIQIWSYYRANGIGYVSDRTTSNEGGSEDDYVQYPYQTLSRKSGDCEDLLALLAASLSVVGVDCGFIDIPGHVMLVIDTKMSPNEVMESGIELAQFVYRNDKYWIPIEATLIGKNSFSQSWIEAIKRYELLISKGILPDLVEFSEAHKLYPPALYSEAIPVRQFENSVSALSLFTADLNEIMLMGQISREEEFLKTIRKYPRNLYIANQYALWCMDNNREATAQNIWEQILGQNPQNFSALVNLGNLLLTNSLYDAARSKYLEALKQSKNTDLIRRNLCILEYRAANLPKAREYFNLLPDKSSLRTLEPKLYSDLLNAGD